MRADRSRRNGQAKPVPCHAGPKAPVRALLAAAQGRIICRMSRYVEPRAARHRVEVADGTEQLRIPARRFWPIVPLLLLWLVLWGYGGVASFGTLLQNSGLFMVIWLIFWCAALIAGAFTLASMVAGSEIVRVTNGDLEISSGVGRLRRRWRYRGAAIRNLRRWDAPEWGYASGRAHFLLPILQRARSGAVRFDYGVECIFFANGVEGPEGAMIAEWLRQRLPAMD